MVPFWQSIGGRTRMSSVLGLVDTCVSHKFIDNILTSIVDWRVIVTQENL